MQQIKFLFWNQIAKQNTGVSLFIIINIFYNKNLSTTKCHDAFVNLSCCRQTETFWLMILTKIILHLNFYNIYILV